MTYYVDGFKSSDEVIDILGLKIEPNAVLQEFKKQIPTDSDTYTLFLVVSDSVADSEPGMYVSILKIYNKKRITDVWDVKRLDDNFVFKKSKLQQEARDKLARGEL